MDYIITLYIFCPCRVPKFWCKYAAEPILLVFCWDGVGSGPCVQSCLLCCFFQDLYRKDCNLAAQLLQCSKSHYRAHKMSEVRTEILPPAYRDFTRSTEHTHTHTHMTKAGGFLDRTYIHRQQKHGLCIKLNRVGVFESWTSSITTLFFMHQLPPKLTVVNLLCPATREQCHAFLRSGRSWLQLHATVI